MGIVLAGLVGAVAAALVAFLMWPASGPPPGGVAPPPAAPAIGGSAPTDASSPLEAPAVTAPAPPGVTGEPPREAVAPTAPVGSRSRGRTDWLFFFKPGDRLARMSDAAPVGVVLRTERAHTFPDGTSGPAYLLQVPEGGQRFLDADEIERGTRLE